MAADRWVRIRNKIEIGAQLISEISTEAKLMGLKEGAPLYLVAREIKHQKNFEWKAAGHPLVLVCDKYDANGGRITTSGGRLSTGPCTPMGAMRGMGETGEMAVMGPRSPRPRIHEDTPRRRSPRGEPGATVAMRARPGTARTSPSRRSTTTPSRCSPRRRKGARLELAGSRGPEA